MGDSGDGKKQKIAADEPQMEVDDAPPLTATNILALVCIAIREEGLARKDDVTALEKTVERRFQGVRQEVGSQLASVNSRLDQSVGALFQQAARLEASAIPAWHVHVARRPDMAAARVQTRRDSL